MRWLRAVKNRLTQNAEGLVPAAQLAAVSACIPLLDRYPFVASADPQWLDFLLSVGGVFVALSELNHEAGSEAAKDEARSTIERALVAWNARGVTSIEDCTQFVDRTYDTLARTAQHQSDPKWLFADSLGLWVVWNLLERAPESTAETNAARAIGTILICDFKTWWKAT